MFPHLRHPHHIWIRSESLNDDAILLMNCRCQLASRSTLPEHQQATKSEQNERGRFGNDGQERARVHRAAVDANALDHTEVGQSNSVCIKQVCDGNGYTSDSLVKVHKTYSAEAGVTPCGRGDIHRLTRRSRIWQM